MRSIRRVILSTNYKLALCFILGTCMYHGVNGNPGTGMFCTEHILTKHQYSRSVNILSTDLTKVETAEYSFRGAWLLCNLSGVSMAVLLTCLSTYSMIESFELIISQFQVFVINGWKTSSLVTKQSVTWKHALKEPIYTSVNVVIF